MKQKTELARALALKPKILLLDEPFAQVDALTRIMLQEELRKLSELKKMTVILVTHSIQEAIFLGDRICVMTHRPGTIKEEINVEFSKPKKMSQLVNEDEFSRLASHLHSHFVNKIQRDGFDHDVT
jgi:NitT/TauT family transport system ATP-binding protein